MEDNVLEQYKKIEGDWKYDYYISRYGSVVRESHMDSSGKLVPRMMLSYILPNKSATVKLVNKDGLQRKVNVASLVLKYFAGVDVKDNRDIIYRDGNRFNCIFENLKYKPDDMEEKVEKELKEEKVEKELKEIKEVGRVISTKYSNLVVYYGSDVVSYFKNTSEAANELIDLLNISRDTIVSSIGKSIKKDRMYHSLKFVCVDDKEYTQITKDIEKQDLSLYLDNKEYLNNKENILNNKEYKDCNNKENILNIVETRLNKEDNSSSKEIDNKESIVTDSQETKINIVSKKDSKENIYKKGNKDIENKISIVETKNIDNKEYKDCNNKEYIVTNTKNSSNIVDKLNSQDIKNIVDKDKETLVETETNNTNTKVISKEKYKKLVDKVKEDIKQEVIQEILEVLSKELDLDLITKFVDNKEANNKVKEVEKKLVTKNSEKEKSITKEIVDIIEIKQDIVDKKTKSNFVDNTLSKAKNTNLFDDIDTDEAYAQFERDMFKEKFYDTYKKMYGIDLRKKR